ncbi:ribonuclease kappa-A-like isoform X2 [Dunckerocampus dactyliophorus]|uniref:ribonuclease kappa-A-like isoform X2 n=1 Tax=Dunckerocampus dactyliophorus TaxID=161453 RepID=UPI0024059723|nr:ribonuclease kappa-A-like isoform X2 [Dunckerocampus dactyliophorus]
MLVLKQKSSMRGLICGPKLAACGVLLSVWGVIMLAVLGICFITHSAVLIEDVPLREEDTQDTNPPQKIYELYDKVAVNCFIAAAVYVVLGIFSCCQMTLNRQKAYMVHL